MSTITLVVIPGPGARSVNIQDNITTIANLVSQESLTNRDIIINGESVPMSAWESTTLSASDEVFATASVKGN
jgi:sulfur carrier protein ThiS